MNMSVDSSSGHLWRWGWKLEARPLINPTNRAQSRLKLPIHPDSSTWRCKHIQLIFQTSLFSSHVQRSFASHCALGLLLPDCPGLFSTSYFVWYRSCTLPEPICLLYPSSSLSNFKNSRIQEFKMAENLPSYEEATSRDAWKIITPYLRPSELKAVSLACKSIANYTTSLLWPQPALYFGKDDEVIFR